MAMLDGLELGLALVGSPPSQWSGAVANFEAGMFPRAAEAAAESAKNGEMFKRVGPFVWNYPRSFKPDLAFH